MPNLLRCYAEGRDGEWEAFCLDLDLAVQGENFEAVYHGLNDTITLYMETVSSLPEADQRRLLQERAPLSLRFNFLIMAIIDLLPLRDENCIHHQFKLPCAA